MRDLRRLWDLPTALLSVALAGFTVVGASFSATDSAAWFWSSAGAALGSLVAVIGIAVLLYTLVTVAFAALDRRWDGSPRSGTESDRRGTIAADPRLWRMWVALIGPWSAWLLLHWPGNIDSDTVTQKLQWLGLQQQTDHHPWFDSMVFGTFWNLGELLGDDRWGMFTFLALQEGAIAFGVAYMLTYLARLGLPRGPRWVLVVAAATLPAFFTGPSVMVKDTFALVFWLPFLVVYVDALRTRGQSLMNWSGAILAIAFSCGLILTKRTNVYLVAVCLAVLLATSVRGRRWRILAGGSIAMLVSTIAWTTLVLNPLGIRPATSTDVLSLPVQQTARIVRDHGDQLPPGEKAVIDEVLRYDGLAAAYTPRRSDPVKGRWNLEASFADRLDYARVWFDQLIRYPGTALSATANNTFEYFAPTTSMSFQDDLDTSRYIEYWKSRSLPTTTVEQITEISDELHNPEALVATMTSVNRATTAFSAGNLLSTKAFYASWIPLIALAFFVRRRSRLHVLATVPAFVNLAFLVASPTALPRYVVASVFGSLFLIGLMLTPIPWARRGAGRKATAPELLADSAGDRADPRPESGTRSAEEDADHGSRPSTA